MLAQFWNGQATKSLVVILTTVASSLALYFGTAKWEPLAVMVIGAIVHYLAPNTSPTPSDPPGGM